MFERVEQWFATSEPNAAGRLGLYRILYGLWFLWLLTTIDVEAIAVRPAPPPAPIGIIKILTLAGVMRHPVLVSTCLALGLGIGLTLMTLGLATRFSTLVVVACSAILFAWDSSFGKVIDKYALLGSVVPFWMLLSRWGDTYSLDSLIRKARRLETPSVSNSSWEFAWPLRAVVVFIVVLYFSSGFTKTINGTWLHNPYVVLDKITGNLNLASINSPKLTETVLYVLTTRVPAIFILGQYLVLAFELTFPLALINGDFRTLIFSAAALFHTMTTILLGIGFAPMIIVLAIAVDWQALYERFWPFPNSQWNGRPRPLLLGLIGLALVVSLSCGWLLAFHSRTSVPFGFLPRQELVWYLSAPFAAYAALKAGRGVVLGLRKGFFGTPLGEIGDA